MPIPPRLLVGLCLLPALVIIRQDAAAQPPAAPEPATAPAVPPGAPKPSAETLESGLRVIVVERRSAPLAALDLRVRAGSAYETPENNGAAHFIEHLLFKGTTARKPGEVDAAIEGVGGELVANTSKDWAQFATVVPSSSWRTALEVLADFVQNPAFRAEDMDRERQVILDEMATAGDDPTRAPYTEIAKVAYPAGHPYRLPLFGTEENVRRLTREDLLTFWRARYTPGNMTLVVVGDVKRDEVVGAARALFAPPPPAAALPAAELPDPGPIPADARAEPLIRDRSLVTTVIGFRAPSVKAAADAVAVDVLLQVLAVGAGGRLNDELVRKKNLALAVSADYLTQRAPGILTLTAIGRNGDAKKLEEALLAEVRRLREDGVSEQEAERARRALTSQILFEEETFSGQANALAFYDAIDSYEFATQYLKRIAAVTAQDLDRVARQYLTPDRYAVATLIPRSAAPRVPSQKEVSR